MRFHLSTLLMSAALLAVGMGWYLDRNLRFSNHLAGTWYSQNTSSMKPYTSTIVFDEGGEFTKREFYRECVATFRGRWSSDMLGNVKIQLHESLHQSTMDGYLGTPAMPVQLDSKYQFAWNLDSKGMLTLTSNSALYRATPPDPRWELNYYRSTFP